MARSRNPRMVVISGALKRACACRSDNQLPTRIPCVLALFTRLMPAASSGASIPLSAASAASLRMADILIMGINGSYVMWTLPLAGQEHQAENAGGNHLEMFPNYP